MADPTGYDLIDAGDGGRLERFGAVVVDRPAPGATSGRRDPGRWRQADLRFDRDQGWSGEPPQPWHVELSGLTFELRLTDAGQVGLFPEHVAHTAWLAQQVAGDGVPTREPPEVLNLFAHTGLATLVLAAAGARVVHVDASRPAVAWARRNAEHSGLQDRPVRWIVDDALGFVRRESRRGRRYDGLALDPPSYGHGADGQAWRLTDGLAELLAACAGIVKPDAFVLLTAHSPDAGPGDLADALEAAFDEPAESGDQVLDATSGAVLHLGAWSRIMGR